MLGATIASPRLDIKILFALTLTHFIGDFYASFISPLSPLFVEKLDLSLAQIGILTGLTRILAFIVQPTVGYLADRYQTRAFFMGGVLLGVIFIPLSGIAPSFWILLPCLAIGAIGNSMFHPSVTGMVPLYAGHKAGFAMSIFNTGGTFSFAVGPLFITWYAATFGLEAIPFTSVIGLLVVAYLFIVVPAPISEGMQKKGFWGTIKDTLGPARKPLILIWAVMVIRAIISQAYLTFMPVYYVSKGYTLISAGMIFTLYLLAGTLSGLAAGHYSDRFGYKPIFLISYLTMPPALLIMLYLPGTWVYTGAFVAGASALATLPLGVVMAQVLAPRGRSMVASLMMGLAYGLGGAFSPLVGKLADIYSIHTVLIWMAFLPLPAIALVLMFPKVRGS